MSERWNPRFLAYAKAHGRTPEEMLAEDLNQRPIDAGGGFAAWLSARAKHTPGPWAVGTDGSPPLIMAPGPASMVAKVYGQDDAAEGDANAALIAAAPTYARAWAMVPEEIRERILRTLSEEEAASLASVEVVP